MESLYAHTSDMDPWESLEDHLQAVGIRAESFASAFGAETLARIAGRWHDLGKASLAFQ